MFEKSGSRRVGLLNAAHVTSCVLAIALLAAPAAAWQQESARWSVDPSAEFSVGTGNSPEETVFDNVVSIAWTGSGRVATVDLGFPGVRMFDLAAPDGTEPTTIGREGEGPGEFLTAIGVWQIPGDSLGVWDPGTRRVTVVGPDGGIGRSNLLTDLPTSGSPDAFLGSFPDGDPVIAALSFGDVGPLPEPDVWDLLRVDLENLTVELITTIRGLERLQRRPIPFSMVPVVLPSGESLLIAQERSATAEILGADGETEARRQLQGFFSPPNRPVERQLRQRLVERQRQVFIDWLDAGDMPIGDSFPTIAGGLVDDQGNFWLKRWAGVDDSVWLRRIATQPAAGGEWVVFGPSGDLIATVAMPSHFRPMAVQGSFVAGVAIGDLGVQSLAIHRIETSGNH